MSDGGDIVILARQHAREQEAKAALAREQEARMRRLTLRVQALFSSSL